MSKRPKTPLTRSEIMARVRSQDTRPEMIVRRGLHGRGYRFRLHRKDLPGKPDLVFPRHNACLFIHGCFWHGHLGCGRMPSTRQDYWLPKISRNAERDAEAANRLLAQGWRVLVVWECAITGRKKLRNADLLDSIEHWLLSSSEKAELAGIIPPV